MIKMIRYTINEEDALRIPVRLSDDVENEYESIEAHNQYADEIDSWREDIACTISRLSYHSIAWDNLGKFHRRKNGTIKARIYGHDIEYAIKNDASIHQDYVYIFRMDMNPWKYGLYESICYNRNKTRHITQSQLRRIVESAVREVLNRQQLNEIYFHEPGVEKHIGEYEVVDGNLWDGKVDGIRDMGWVQDVRLYSSDKPNGRTYALYKRCDNGKFFFVEVVDDESNPKKSKAVRIKSTDVPEPIVSDALSLVRRDRKGLNLFS